MTTKKPAPKRTTKPKAPARKRAKPVTETFTIPLRNRAGIVVGTAYIDAADKGCISARRWCLGGGGYARRGGMKDGRYVNISMHRLIVGAPKEMEVDHIDGNRLNNCRSNLRLCTSSQNKWNRGKSRSNTSGYKGVTYDRLRQKWRAKIFHRTKSIYIGNYPTPEIAHRAYVAAARRLHGEFSHV